MKTDNRVLLLEDDPEQVELFKEEVDRDWPGDKPKVQVFRSEAEFRDWWETAQEPFPALYVLDLLLRWKSSGLDVRTEKPDPNPPDLAGQRCRELIRQKHPGAQVVVWTVIDLSTIPEAAIDKSVIQKCPLKDLLRRVQPHRTS